MVDKTMFMFPNALKDHKMIGSNFFLLQKTKLLKNKNKEVEEQDPHIQAETIRSKLNSVTRFLKFLENPSIFGRFERGERIEWHKTIS